MSRPAALQDPSRIFDLLPYALQKAPKPDAFATKVNGVWQKYSTQEVVEIVDELAFGLRLAGVQRGDRVANITEANRPEWNFVDLATTGLGAVHVPIYPSITLEEFRFILQDSGAIAVFVSSARLFGLIQSLLGDLPALRQIYSYEEVAGAIALQKLREEGRSRLNDAARDDLAQVRAAVQPGDMATLIYTSGTTGTPKGVMLSHLNLMSNCSICCGIIGSGPEERALSFLPLCHIYERTIVNIYLRSGTSVYYAESLDTIGENLREVKPQIFTTVPRLLEKIYERIVDRGEKLKGVQHRLFTWALHRALNYRLPGMSWLDRLQLLVADRLVYVKWRKALGGNIRAIVSGSAALRPQLAQVFWAAGMPVYEGYGPTEASPVISVNRPSSGDHQIGTVGLIIPGGEVKIAADGEILYRGPNVMMGYYHRPDLTAEAIDGDGWLHTGDIGEFSGKFLKITDRKKEIFKTSGGKYIAPQQTENKLKESPFIDQAMVVGENHKFPAALLVPCKDRLREHLQAQGLPPRSGDELTSHSAVRELFEDEISKVNKGLSRYAQIKKFVLIPDEWTVSGGELTPTLKLKRRYLLQKYGRQIDELYAGEERAAEALKKKTPTSAAKDLVQAPNAPSPK
jgi:long-chain acyl-CoA synthetase